MDKIAVECKSREQAIKVIKHVRKPDNLYDPPKNAIFIIIKSDELGLGSYCSERGWLNKRDFTIISYQDFERDYLKLNNTQHAEYYKYLGGYTYGMDDKAKKGLVYKYEERWKMCYNDEIHGYCGQDSTAILEWFSPATKEEYEAQFKKNTYITPSSMEKDKWYKFQWQEPTDKMIVIGKVDSKANGIVVTRGDIWVWRDPQYSVSEHNAYRLSQIYNVEEISEEKVLEYLSEKPVAKEKIMQFMSKIDINKSALETNLIVGRWYKGWKNKDCLYAKFLRMFISGGNEYFEWSEAIHKHFSPTQYMQKTGNWWYDNENLKEASAEEIQKYLPEGHVDKIKPQMKVEVEDGKYYFTTYHYYDYIFLASSCYVKYLCINLKSYYENGWWFWTDNSAKNLRPATELEEKWLKACIDADKFVPMESVMESAKEEQKSKKIDLTPKTMKKEDFVIGKWYRYKNVEDIWLFKYAGINGDKTTASRYINNLGKPQDTFSSCFSSLYYMNAYSPADMEEIYKHFPDERPNDDFRVGDWVVKGDSLRFTAPTVIEAGMACRDTAGSTDSLIKIDATVMDVQVKGSAKITLPYKDDTVKINVKQSKSITI